MVARKNNPLVKDSHFEINQRIDSSPATVNGDNLIRVLLSVCVLFWVAMLSFSGGWLVAALRDQFYVYFVLFRGLACYWEDDLVGWQLASHWAGVPINTCGSNSFISLSMLFVLNSNHYKERPP